MTTRTRFSVQSTSKLYTATSVLLAVRDALVDLDEPITAYLPEFTVASTFESQPASRITLRHLLSHTAGFTHEAPEGSNYSIGDGDFEAHCQSIYGTWLRFPVGQHHEYSNLGIDLAGYILQRCSGMSFERYVQQRLLEPLGLTRSTFDGAVIAADSGRAIGHWRPFEQASRPLPVKIPMVAAGGLYSSVDDALRYVQNHLRGGEQLLTAGLLREQYKISFPAPGQARGYGLGLYLDEWEPGVRVRQHGGSGFGFQSQLCWLPDTGIGMVILTNYFNHSLQNQLAHRIAKHLAGAAPGRATAVPGRPSAAAGSGRGTSPADAGSDPAPGELAGEYVGRMDRVQVLTADGRLCVRGTETTGGQLPAPTTRPLEDCGAGRFRFLADPGGRVRYLQDLRDGTVRYKNDEASTPPSALAPGEAGSYAMAAWGVPVAWYRVYQDGSSPVIQEVPAPGGADEPGAALRLAPMGAGRYLSATGEVLDFGSPAPTYANIPLTRVRG